MVSADVVGLIGLFVAIGGQYALLFQINRGLNNLELDLATCPYHRTGRSPPGVVSDE